MSRRASLPGIDELFGTSSPGPQEQGAASAPEGAGPQEPVVAEALALVRQMAADEGAELQAVRDAAQGLDVPSPEVGSLLRWAATAAQARAVVEIGSAGGLSGRWLVEGMAPGGVLTSLEPDPEAHRLAARAFAPVTEGPRVRAIHGEPGTLLERLADASYDLVILQTDRAHYPEHLARARTLLRPGGLLVARGIVPVDEYQGALTRFLHDLVEDPVLSVTVLPFDDGIALAHRLPDPA